MKVINKLANNFHISLMRNSFAEQIQKFVYMTFHVVNYIFYAFLNKLLTTRTHTSHYPQIKGKIAAANIIIMCATMNIMSEYEIENRQTDIIRETHI